MQTDFDAIACTGPLADRRHAGLERWRADGFPTRRDEPWRYCDLRDLAEGDLRRAPSATIDASVLDAHVVPGCDRLVFVNGRYDAALSSVGALPDGATVTNLAAALDHDAVVTHCAQHASVATSPFTALNQAFIEDGLVVVLGAGVALERPIQVIHVSTGGEGIPTSHPRHLILAKDGATGTIVETYCGAGDGVRFVNPVTELIAGGTAELQHVKVVRDTAATWHIGTLQIHQSGTSKVTTACVTFDGGTVRNELNTVLDNDDCECTMNGLSIGTGTMHIDNQLRVDHDKPNCRSWEFFKGIFDDTSSGAFCGRIFVAQDAQKTDAKQTNMNLLLSDDCEVNTRPQLEIFADDVKCTHGATIGELEPSQMFYLRSRGIDTEAARSMLVYAFANEVLEEIPIEALREQMEGLLLERLPQGDVLRGGV